MFVCRTQLYYPIHIKEDWQHRNIVDFQFGPRHLSMCPERERERERERESDSASQV